MTAWPFNIPDPVRAVHFALDPDCPYSNRANCPRKAEVRRVLEAHRQWQAAQQPAETAPPTRVAIDLNVRVRGGTRVGFEDADGPLAVGQHVQVHEPESGLHGPATVAGLDGDKRLAYLALDWGLLHLHEDCDPCDVLDPCPCCGLRFVDGQYVTVGGAVYEPTRPPLTVLYRNHAGVVAVRRLIPRRVWHGTTEWHPESQWLLDSWDVDRQAERTYALAGFLGGVTVDERPEGALAVPCGPLFRPHPPHVWRPFPGVPDAWCPGTRAASEGATGPYSAPEAPEAPEGHPTPERPSGGHGAACDAVYAFIRSLGDQLPPDPVHRNAVIWRAVHAALNALED